MSLPPSPRDTRALRALAVRRSLAPAPSLQGAIDRLGFVQMDPLRVPARAQDLILRHRAPRVRAGSLEARYPALDVEEDVLYAYGVVPRSIWALLHPRLAAGDAPYAPAGLEREVLAFVREHAPPHAVHPSTVAAALGAVRERNAWGGQSRATTRALERLHYWGLLRVARRVRGVRCYAPAATPPPAAGRPDAHERLARLTLLAAGLFAPVPEATLREVVALMRRYAAPHLGRGDTDRDPAGRRRALLDGLLADGRLQAATIDGLRYLWPAAVRETARDGGARARILAPFDPVVWDRRRFAHLWGWPYRFEAYTPAPRRRYAHYAMPLLWRDDAIGWVTASTPHDVLDVQAHFVRGRPADRAFARAFDAEVERLRAFLSPNVGASASRAPARPHARAVGATMPGNEGA